VLPDTEASAERSVLTASPCFFSLLPFALSTPKNSPPTHAHITCPWPWRRLGNRRQDVQPMGQRVSCISLPRALPLSRHRLVPKHPRYILVLPPRTPTHFFQADQTCNERSALGVHPPTSSHAKAKRRPCPMSLLWHCVDAMLEYGVAGSGGLPLSCRLLVQRLPLVCPSVGTAFGACHSRWQPAKHIALTLINHARRGYHTRPSTPQSSLFALLSVRACMWCPVANQA